MDPYLITAEGTAFANVYEKWNETPPARSAPVSILDEELPKPVRHISLTINIGHTRTIVMAFEGGSLIGVRSILWGGKNIAEAIARKYEIPYLESLKELQTKAFILTNKQGATFDQVTFSDTIAKSVRELSRDLQLSILEFKSEFNAELTSIGLTGGTSQIQNLGPFLTQILEVPVNRVSSLDTVPNITFERTPRNGAILGVAIGLAIEGFKKPRNPPVNFMRGEFAKENHQLKMFWEKWGPTTKMAATALLIMIVFGFLREEFARGLADRSLEVLKDQARAVGLRGRNASENSIRKYIRDNKKRATDLKTLSSVANMNSALDVLKMVSEAAPARAAITLDVQQFNVQDAQVALQGYVNSPKEVTLLQQALANIAEGQVKAANPSLQARPGKTAFSFSFNIDRGIQKVTR
jgi:general secretion pathway protein L